MNVLEIGSYTVLAVLHLAMVIAIVVDISAVVRGIALVCVCC